LFEVRKELRNKIQGLPETKDIYNKGKDGDVWKGHRQRKCESS
jgi:hypothetical protein